MTSIVRWSVDKVGRRRSWDTAARCGPRGTGRGAGRASPGQLGPRGGRAGSRRAWGSPEGGRLDALRHLGPWPPRASPGRPPRGGGRPRAGSPPPRHRVCDTSRPGPGCTGGTVACARGPHGVTGCPVPAPGTVGGGRWLQSKSSEQSPGRWGAAPRRPRAPRGPPAGRRRWRGLPRACRGVRAGADVASFSVGSVGVSNYIYFHKLELCFI